MKKTEFKKDKIDILESKHKEIIERLNRERIEYDIVSNTRRDHPSVFKTLKKQRLSRSGTSGMFVFGDSNVLEDLELIKK
ncbi:hypothetical protein CWI38_0603p0050 [Hamiltosporidium tvaerminnensis]|uniref:Uncharacterized protein n=1 Tax=Hamiltosporidium tvaerminnensis TaxID=1176355 RepID=A0A4Q9LYL4_9MICR|nr:hypothetical protein CWI38_0603p0050 [Hamiltosporidium tvaerminnensis]